MRQFFKLWDKFLSYASNFFPNLSHNFFADKREKKGQLLIKISNIALKR